MSALREVLGDLYDAGFFATYPNPEGRVKARSEAIEAALEAIGSPKTSIPDPEFGMFDTPKMSADEAIIRETLREFTTIPTISHDVTVRGLRQFDYDRFIEAFMERLKASTKYIYDDQQE